MSPPRNPLGSLQAMRSDERTAGPEGPHAVVPPRGVRQTNTESGGPTPGGSGRPRPTRPSVAAGDSIQGAARTSAGPAIRAGRGRAAGAPGEASTPDTARVAGDWVPPAPGAPAWAAATLRTGPPRRPEPAPPAVVTAPRPPVRPPARERRSRRGRRTKPPRSPRAPRRPTSAQRAHSPEARPPLSRSLPHQVTNVVHRPPLRRSLPGSQDFRSRGRGRPAHAPAEGAGRCGRHFTAGLVGLSRVGRPRRAAHRVYGACVYETRAVYFRAAARGHPGPWGSAVAAPAPAPSPIVPGCSGDRARALRSPRVSHSLWEGRTRPSRGPSCRVVVAAAPIPPEGSVPATPAEHNAIVAFPKGGFALERGRDF